MTKTCVQCGKTFEISKAEQDYYKSQHVPVPTCCRSCRKSNRIVEEISVPKRYLGLIYKRSERRRGKIGMVFRGKYLIFSLVALLLFSWATDRRMRQNYNAPVVSGSAMETTNPADIRIFRNFDLLNEHFKKHGRDMGYTSADAYLEAANNVIHNPAALHKKQAEDGDDIYFLNETNDLVIVSTDGYIRTYFRPEDGIAYYNRQ